MKLNIRSSYKQYKQNAKHEVVDVNTFAALCGDYNAFLIKVVLAGHKVALPNRMGSLEIRGKKQKITVDEAGRVKGTGVDWKRTKELWEKNPEARHKKTLVYYTNAHSAGFRYKFLWSKKNALATNKFIYRLRMTRDNKRTLAARIKDGKEY